MKKIKMLFTLIAVAALPIFSPVGMAQVLSGYKCVQDNTNDDTSACTWNCDGISVCVRNFDGGVTCKNCVLKSFSSCTLKAPGAVTSVSRVVFTGDCYGIMYMCGCMSMVAGAPTTHYCYC
jgi:hypothetical protein